MSVSVHWRGGGGFACQSCCSAPPPPPPLSLFLRCSFTRPSVRLYTARHRSYPSFTTFHPSLWWIPSFTGPARRRGLPPAAAAAAAAGATVRAPQPRFIVAVDAAPVADPGAAVALRSPLTARSARPSLLPCSSLVGSPVPGLVRAFIHFSVRITVSSWRVLGEHFFLVVMNGRMAAWLSGRVSAG
jgi:hypothetical protein